MASTFLKTLSTASINDETITKECKNIATEIQEGRLKLYAFVEDLGVFLTTNDLDLRTKAVAILSHTLSLISKDFLTESELKFLTMFYCDRLKDHHSIIPDILTGILAMVRMDRLSSNMSAKLCTALFGNVRCQAELKEERFKIYSIISILLKTQSEELHKMGADFIYGVISAIDTEKDPNNLMFLFNMLPSFIQEFPLGHLTEEMFEVLSCYFPVDFNPLGSEKGKITRTELANALAPCLCATPEFAEFCIPLINDKLSSDLEIAKLDSLALLNRGASIFGIEGLKPHLHEIWMLLKKEIISSSNEDIKNYSLKTLKSIIQVLTTDEIVCENFIKKILKDTQLSLLDLHSSLFKSTIKLFETIASANKISCVVIMRTLVPLCLGQYSSKTCLEDKVIVMETLNKFLKICEFDVKDIPDLAWTDIPQLYFNEINSINDRLKTQAIVGLTLQKKHLNENHRNLLYKKLCYEIENDSERMLDTYFQSMLNFATLYPEEMILLFDDRLALANSETEKSIEIRRLEASMAVSRIPELCVKILPKVISVVMNSNDEEFTFTAFKCLYELISFKQTFNVHHFLYNNCNIIESILSCKIDTVADRRLPLMTNICQSVVRQLSMEDQMKIVDKYITLLSDNASQVKLIICGSLFVPLHSSINFNITDEMLENLFNVSIYGKESLTRQSSCKLLSVYVNKINRDDKLLDLTNYFVERIKCLIETSNERKVKEASIVLLIWITKATVTKGSSNSQELLILMTNLLKTTEIVAKEYKILVKKTEDALIETNHCNVKFLYKQRIFEHLLLQNQYFSTRKNYLIALMNVLEELPDELLFINLTKLVPLLIESLSLDHQDLVYSALIILKPLISTKNQIFIDKIQSFVPTLLKLSTHPAMIIRIVVLDCLTLFCDFPIIDIQKYKQDVLDGLTIVVDDRKRLVRKSAVHARTRWFLVGAPGGLK